VELERKSEALFQHHVLAMIQPPVLDDYVGCIPVDCSFPAPAVREEEEKKKKKEKERKKRKKETDTATCVFWFQHLQGTGYRPSYSLSFNHQNSALLAAYPCYTPNKLEGLNGSPDDGGRPLRCAWDQHESHSNFVCSAKDKGTAEVPQPHLPDNNLDNATFRDYD